jgi:hypothetical protein
MQHAEVRQELHMKCLSNLLNGEHCVGNVREKGSDSYIRV